MLPSRSIAAIFASHGGQVTRVKALQPRWSDFSAGRGAQPKAHHVIRPLRQNDQKTSIERHVANQTAQPGFRPMATRRAKH
jgi:hypothetical protein